MFTTCMNRTILRTTIFQSTFKQSQSSHVSLSCILTYTPYRIGDCSAFTVIPCPRKFPKLSLSTVSQFIIIKFSVISIRILVDHTIINKILSKFILGIMVTTHTIVIDCTWQLSFPGTYRSYTQYRSSYLVI